MKHLSFIQKMHKALDEASLDPHGWEIRSLDGVGSTNTRANDMLGLYDRVIILSKTQSKGRGRGENIWFSPKGGLWMSIGFLTDIDPIELSTPVIEEVHKVLSEYVDCSIKEPNDILIGDRKVCGILVESEITSNRIKRVIVGIGVNISNELPDEVNDIATRLADHADSPPEILDLATSLGLGIITRLRPHIPEL